MTDPLRVRSIAVPRLGAIGLVALAITLPAEGCGEKSEPPVTTPSVTTPTVPSVPTVTTPTTPAPTTTAPAPTP
jgi:hypothetical protein